MILNVLKIFQIISVLSIFGQFKAQIKINWQLDSQKKIANITLYNESNENIIIPIDTTSLQPYYSDNYNIIQHEWIDQYPFFGLTINIYDNCEQKNVETYLHSEIDLSEFEKIKIKNDSIKKEFNVKIEKWGKKNNVPKSDVKINYYIMNNLLLLKPQEKIVFHVPFNLKNITNRDVGPLQGFYVLDNEKENIGYLSISIDKEAYIKYLTKSQRKKLNRYKLFTGSIKSNKINILSTE
ncbi:hypothetical protein [Chryseobacterium sp. S90]|uniref:hypothetical protein n=1 Tax=Chryseobacterium sp. S90 TaxID=3395373 RepID=UPI0039BD60EF